EELIDERTQALKQANISLQIEVKNRRNAELAALTHKKNLQNVIDSASEIIIAFDYKHRIIIWNKSAELLTGFNPQQIYQKPVSKTPVFYDPEQLIKILDQIQKRKPTKFNELLLLTKDHAKRFLSISYSLIQSNETNQMGILLIGRDITNLRKTQDNMQNGCCYLISHEDDTHVLDLFIEFSQRNNYGLLMLRGTLETIQNLPSSKNIKIVLLSHHSIENVHTISTIDDLITTTHQFYEQHPESVVLLQGVHYLLTRFSFEEFINMVYELRELTSLYHAIFLLKIDPVLFTNQQLAVLHHEIQSLPILYTDSILISQASYDILQFIYEKNQRNALVTIKDIAKKFSIVYRTASKRLDILKNMGLIVIKKYGRSRGVYVTEKAKILIKNRKEPT
ncbi:MAG: DUF835 domain-containing protein, partial [Candidatus Thermoplasmatota archaeon]|nr:DUF835 domain-containing protein [Candidatus Thermoplasmatota archaeon]